MYYMCLYTVNIAAIIMYTIYTNTYVFVHTQGLPHEVGKVAPPPAG